MDQTWFLHYLSQTGIVDGDAENIENHGYLQGTFKANLWGIRQNTPVFVRMESIDTISIRYTTFDFSEWAEWEDLNWWDEYEINESDFAGNVYEQRIKINMKTIQL